jgi:hypothetical protein
VLGDDALRPKIDNLAGIVSGFKPVFEAHGRICLSRCSRFVEQIDTDDKAMY